MYNGTKPSLSVSSCFVYSAYHMRKGVPGWFYGSYAEPAHLSRSQLGLSYFIEGPRLSTVEVKDIKLPHFLFSLTFFSSEGVTLKTSDHKCLSKAFSECLADILEFPKKQLQKGSNQNIQLKVNLRSYTQIALHHSSS